ncbi:hypothetical protein cand_007730 [Cryptosporidium andersoni]|uniref:Uncharacterized protein n=1 Tax=Cryptosporidium andersoni TaxID=117008 RepID=A0A1J4MRF7_9CRYT|nr:hypothetical protein cand_007730 [Cryptosporidium andersoni]
MEIYVSLYYLIYDFVGWQISRYDKNDIENCTKYYIGVWNRITDVMKGKNRSEYTETQSSLNIRVVENIFSCIGALVGCSTTDETLKSIIIRTELMLLGTLLPSHYIRKMEEEFNVDISRCDISDLYMHLSIIDEVCNISKKKFPYMIRNPLSGRHEPVEPKNEEFKDRLYMESYSSAIINLIMLILKSYSESIKETGTICCNENLKLSLYSLPLINMTRAPDLSNSQTHIKVIEIFNSFKIKDRQDIFWKCLLFCKIYEIISSLLETTDSDIKYQTFLLAQKFIEEISDINKVALNKHNSPLFLILQSEWDTLLQSQFPHSLDNNISFFQSYSRFFTLIQLIFLRELSQIKEYGNQITSLLQYFENQLYVNYIDMLVFLLNRIYVIVSTMEIRQISSEQQTLDERRVDTNCDKSSAWKILQIFLKELYPLLLPLPDNSTLCLLVSISTQLNFELWLKLCFASFNTQITNYLKEDVIPTNNTIYNGLRILYQLILICDIDIVAPFVSDIIYQLWLLFIYIELDMLFSKHSSTDLYNDTERAANLSENLNECIKLDDFGDSSETIAIIKKLHAEIANMLASKVEVSILYQIIETISEVSNSAKHTNKRVYHLLSSFRMLFRDENIIL